MSPTLDIRGSIPEIIRNDDHLYPGDLIAYFKILFFEATSGRNPYHNFRHTCHVLWQVWNACRFYSDTLSPKQRRNLLVGALFHDFNHTGEAGNDDVNIRIAVGALNDHILPEDISELDEIGRLIEKTRFPYLTPSEEMDLSVQILRDADMTQALSVAWIQQVVFGLSAEWGKDPIEVLQIQAPFLSNLTFQTEWAQQMFPPEVLEQKITEAQKLVELLLTTEEAMEPSAV